MKTRKTAATLLAVLLVLFVSLLPHTALAAEDYADWCNGWDLHKEPLIVHSSDVVKWTYTVNCFFVEEYCFSFTDDHAEIYESTKVALLYSVTHTSCTQSSVQGSGEDVAGWTRVYATGIWEVRFYVNNELRRSEYFTVFN